MTQGSYVFNPPPNWPSVPEGWTPPEGWQPDASWGPAPEGWEFWRYMIPEQPVEAPPAWAAPPAAPPLADAPSVHTVPPTPPAAEPAEPPLDAPPVTAAPAAVAPTTPVPTGPVAPPTFLPGAPQVTGNWFARHKVVTGVAAAFLVLVAINATGGGADAPASTQISLADASGAGTGDKAAADKAAAEKAAADKAAAAKAAADKAAAAKAAADKAAAAKAAAAKAAKAKGPADQQAVLAAVVTGRAGYDATDNELKQRQAQRQRAEELRAAVPGLEVTDWIGEIKSLDTNGEGKAVLELKIGSDTKVSTWNNAFSDFEDKTLISMDSPMYATLVELEEGAKIRFSGSFFSDEENGLKEKSLTFFGQMNTPNFLFRFTDVTPI